MRSEDSVQDSAYQVYLHARSKDAKALALVQLLRVSEGFIARAVRHWSRGPIRELEFEDALQTARIGFLVAVHRADPLKGPLRPFALSRIRHELQTQAEVSFGIKVPRRSGLPAKVQHDIQTLWSREGREPTPEELGEHAVEYESVRPRVVTSFDASEDLAESFASEDKSPLDIILEREDEESRASPMILSIVTSALAHPALPHPHPNKRPSMPENPKSPLETFTSAIDDMKTYLSDLDAQEAEIQRKRTEATTILAKASVQSTVIAVHGASGTTVQGALGGRPVLALNQDKLPNRIVAYLKDNPQSRVSTIALAVGDTSENAGQALIKLRSIGTVMSEGKARGTTYSLAQPSA